jgi:hypothetical protein
MSGNSCVDAQLAASQEGLSSMELATHGTPVGWPVASHWLPICTNTVSAMLRNSVSRNLIPIDRSFNLRRGSSNINACLLERSNKQINNWLMHKTLQGLLCFTCFECCLLSHSSHEWYYNPRLEWMLPSPPHLESTLLWRHWFEIQHTVRSTVCVLSWVECTDCGRIRKTGKPT